MLRVVVKNKSRSCQRNKFALMQYVFQNGKGNMQIVDVMDYSIVSLNNKGDLNKNMEVEKWICLAKLLKQLKR